MERYSFEEIKNFKIGDVFWANSTKFSVDSEPIYKNQSNFYGDYSESVEWTGITDAPHKQTKFQVSNLVKGEESESQPLIFKTPTSENAEAIIDYEKVYGANNE
jgi:hypothetical protein